MITLIIFIILTINYFPATGVSTLKVGDQLNHTSRLVSPNNNFTLGFFTIPATNSTYLGIWYTNDEQYRRVWVANPSTPITSSSTLLMIDPYLGRIIIATTGGTVIVNISDNNNNKFGQTTNLTATLQDTGDFQLKNETDNRIIWRSFDHPTNVFLPGMKLGSDLKTGRNWNLTSWLSDEVPDVGAFSLSWVSNGENSQRLLVQQRGRLYWTSGDLRGHMFEFMIVNDLLQQCIHTFTEDEEN
ncbi:putative non-specific serine/threonine protein kinase [Helianthus annuus]|nr:putative non-specific serine/threonine protein kinase [Helianthus annuus]